MLLEPIYEEALPISAKVADIPGIGPRSLTRLEKLGIVTIADLLTHFPRKWQDLSHLVSIDQIQAGQEVTIRGKITDIKNSPYFRRVRTTKALIKDESGLLKVTWFNQTYLEKSLPVGSEVVLSGQIKNYKDELILQNPIYEFLSAEPLHTGRIVPIYPETKGLSSRLLRKYIKLVLDNLSSPNESLPQATVKKFSLLTNLQAIRQIHFPESLDDIDKAIRRLTFDELFPIITKVQQMKAKRASLKAPKIKEKKTLTKNFFRSLPFTLTIDQKKAAQEIFNDLAVGQPMNRLLEGDVGSGKTVVAAVAILQMAEAGRQTALMAPTTILAEQHFETLGTLLELFSVRVGLITGQKIMIGSNAVSANALAEKIKKGEIDLVVGTQTLIAGKQKAKFKKLGLVIIDEQHKFGVRQRQNLRELDKKVHLLSLTATPIPRTLAMSVYGDLEISQIKSKPQKRKKIITKLFATDKARTMAHKFIKQELNKDHQAFVVLPVIEESQKTELRSVKAEFDRLRQDVFKDYKLGLLHGRLRQEEKEAVMKEFADGESQVLVTTPVVEVGIDVPRATVMVIENAERYGLATLHQLRGRVGRSNLQSYALLFTSSDNPETIGRLKNFTHLHNGFKLAEMDLANRGAGHLFGTAQHGFRELKLAKLTDTELIGAVKREVLTMLDEDPKLQNFPIIREKAEALDLILHEE